MRAGPYELTFLDMGNLRLDGGAMFGVVPRPVWQGWHVVFEHDPRMLATRGASGEGGVVAA